MKEAGGGLASQEGAELEHQAVFRLGRQAQPVNMMWPPLGGGGAQLLDGMRPPSQAPPLKRARTAEAWDWSDSRLSAERARRFQPPRGRFPPGVISLPQAVAAAGGSSGGAAKTTWAFVPPNPKELTPATTGCASGQGSSLVGTVSLSREKSMSGFGSTK